jgi:hypothetical protein
MQVDFENVLVFDLVLGLHFHGVIVDFVFVELVKELALQER